MAGNQTADNPTAAGPTAIPWTDYIGSHDRSADWGKSVRGVGRRESPVPPSSPASSDTLLESELTLRLRQISPSRTLVMPVGGLAGARDRDQVAAFLDQVESDGGSAWRAEVRQRAEAIRPVLSQSRGIYLQIGNEINSHHYGTAISSWQGGRGRVESNSEAIIPVYTEYFLAPAVEALRDFDWGAEAASRVHVVLGSVANSANPRSRAWLYDLLDYRIRGDFAPSLSGKRVVEVIDLATIHYLVTGADVEWLEILDSLKTRWIDSGLVSGVWGTEELGRRRADAELGAMTAMKVTSRYLHWWSTRGVLPDQSRFLLWGSRRGQPGNTGDDAMELLYQFLGNSLISDVSALLDVSPQANVEAYAFETVGEPGRRVIFL